MGYDIKSDMESFEHLQRRMQACIPKGFNAMHYSGFYLNFGKHLICLNVNQFLPIM
jgi:hypothetical protein